MSVHVFCIVIAMSLAALENATAALMKPENFFAAAVAPKPP